RELDQRIAFGSHSEPLDACLSQAGVRELNGKKQRERKNRVRRRPWQTAIQHPVHPRAQRAEKDDGHLGRCVMCNGRASRRAWNPKKTSSSSLKGPASAD